MRASSGGRTLISLERELPGPVDGTRSAMAQVHQLQGLLPICWIAKRSGTTRTIGISGSTISPDAPPPLSHIALSGCFTNGCRNSETAKWLKHDDEEERHLHQASGKLNCRADEKDWPARGETPESDLGLRIRTS